MNNSAQKGLGESGLYNRIAVLRAERGISRQDLADAMDVNYQTIGFLERGDYSPSLKLALSLAEYFGLPVEAIFSKQPFQPLSQQVYGTGSIRGFEHTQAGGEDPNIKEKRS
jgi:DNA-binding XRE family transcriptional regulator